jgi:hypothetical protein
MADFAFFGSVIASACTALVQCWRLIVISGSDWGGGSGLVNLGLFGMSVRLLKLRSTAVLPERRLDIGLRNV